MVSSVPDGFRARALPTRPARIVCSPVVAISHANQAKQSTRQHQARVRFQRARLRRLRSHIDEHAVAQFPGQMHKD